MLTRAWLKHNIATLLEDAKKNANNCYKKGRIGRCTKKYMAGSRIELGTSAVLVRNFTTELPRPIFMIHLAPTTKHTYMQYHI